MRNIPMNPTEIKGVAYMRYSSDNQTENSIAYQRRAICTYCAANKIQLVGEYVDEAYSATNDKRPVFREMIDDAVNNPEWRMVLVYDMSRFARNNSDAVKYSNRLRDADIELVSITQTFGNSNEGFLLEGITNLINDYYSRNNAKHTHAGMMVKAQQGKHYGGTPPLGYDVDSEGNLTVNESEAEIVRLIFDMYELNYTYSDMAKILNERGYTNKRGAAFGKTSFDSILRQEKYIGKFSWNRVRHKNSKGEHNSHAYKPVDQQIIIESGCPAIITEGQFNRVQRLLDSKDKNNIRNKNRHHYMLSGLKILKCAECGSYMIGKVVQSHGKLYLTYSCPKRKTRECKMRDIPAESLEAFVAETLVSDLRERTDINKISAMMTYTKDYRTAKDKLKGLDMATRNIMRVLEHGCTEEVVEKLKSLSASKRALKNIISDYELNARGINECNIEDITEKFGDVLIHSDDPEIRMYLRDTIEVIEAGIDEINMTLKIA